MTFVEHFGDRDHADVRPGADALERAVGTVGLRFRAVSRGTAVADLKQGGCGRALFPVDAGRHCQAVVANVGGGLTGGDRFQVAVTVESGAAATVTTQACEKIYRSTGPDAAIATSLKVEAGATLHWLPQETILFDGARLARRLDVTVAAGASVILLEAVVLGRTARGEVLTSGHFTDRWRLRRDGQLLHAEQLRLDPAARGALSGAATLGGKAAFATLFAILPDPAGALSAVRAALAETGDSDIEAGASLIDDRLIVRALATTSWKLRSGLLPVLAKLSGEPLPRVWMV
jgi:urease accessory protein